MNEGSPPPRNNIGKFLLTSTFFFEIIILIVFQFLTLIPDSVQDKETFYIPKCRARLAKLSAAFRIANEGAT